MAEKKGKYIINGSNYTLKRKHKVLEDGTIYERDYMATTNLGGFSSGIFPNEENNFKIVPAETATVRRRHHYGENSETFTLNDIDKKRNRQSTESRLTLADKHTSLLDFVYYGSCVEFLKSSIENIISNFPGELYFTSRKVLDNIDGKNWYYVDNPFEIDLWSITAPDYGVNGLRYFAKNIESYVAYNSSKEELGCLSRLRWSSQANTDFASCDGQYTHAITLEINAGTTIELRRYYLNGGYSLLYAGTTYNGWYIRPGQTIINEVFENLGDFEKTLLNRNTQPLYSAVLDYPHEVESGFETYKKIFTWPQVMYTSRLGNRRIISHAYNIDIKGEKFQTYVNELLELCRFYDEYFTDNIWRNLTHDAIKNLDNTFVHEDVDNSKEDIKENVEKVHKFILACGRQFDDIKRYADGIKNANAITYNGEGNLPDYFLTDALNLSGWEITNSLRNVRIVKPVGQSNVFIPILVKGLFKGIVNKEYDSVDTNVQFLKNLKLNSQEILSRKGTRYGIEMLLGLFGMVSKDFGSSGYDYSIEEFVRIATPTENAVSGSTELTVEKYGAMRLSQSDTIGEGSNPEPYDKLPVKIIEFNVSTGNTTVYRTMVPWFRMKNEYGRPYEHDGNIYFQMYGGWDKIDGKYGETQNYLGVVETRGNLMFVPASKLHNDDIFYCIDDDTYYIYKESKWEEYARVRFHSGITSYEIYSGETWIVGTTSGSTEADLAITEAKEKINFLESIVDTELGNNPHTGYGHYDDGEEFYDYLKQIFKYSIDNEGFSDEAYRCGCNGNNCFPSDLTECGFNIEEKVADNVKCWYFNPSHYLPNNGNHEDVEISEFDGHYNVSSGYSPYDFETDEEGNLTEGSSYSVINDKNLVITFNLPSAFTVAQKEEYKSYITDAVMPYVRQMVPSTAILSIQFR